MLSLYIYTFICIYIYRERETETERQRDRESGRQRERTINIWVCGRSDADLGDGPRRRRGGHVLSRGRYFAVGTSYHNPSNYIT